MFGRVAHRYDFANHLLSFGIDRLWRRRVVKLVRPVLHREGALVLDLCCGTGDLMLALGRNRGHAVMGSDFCHPMLKAASRKDRQAPLIEADGLLLPFSNGSLDLITIAFGFRNFANYEAGLIEMRRVLRPNGLLAILEFSQPPNNFLRTVYEWYSGCVLPKIGGIVSGSRDAYEYLPSSVRKFPGAEELARMMEAAGFAPVTFQRLTFGVVAIHLGHIKQSTSLECPSHSSPSDR